MENRANKKIEPFLMVVLAKRLEVITKEMTNTLLRTARSGVINSARDFACTITDAKARTINVAGGNLNQIVGTSLVAKVMLDFFDDLRPGDCVLNNSPYYGGNHHADYTYSAPVFYKDELLFTVNARAHQADCGNAQPTTYMAFAKDVYEEGGLDFPCVRFQRDYKDLQDIIRMCKVRIRVPDQWYGDYLAQVGSLRIAERRLTELCDKYGTDTIKTFIEQWIDYGERRMIEEIGKYPKGTWKGETKHDPIPGVSHEGITLRLRMMIDPDEGYVDLDFTESDDLVPGGFNLSLGSIMPAACTGILNNFDHTIPHNEGSFRRIRFKFREGSVAAIQKVPTCTSVSTTNLADRMVNLVQSMFAQFGEDKGIAEGALGMPASYSVISGIDWRTGGPYVNQLIMGSWGGPALFGYDGWVNYGIPVVGGTILIDSVEVNEQKYPIIFEDNELIPDSGGPGCWRGAPGVRCTMRPRHDPGKWTYLIDGHFYPAKGIHGGLSGKASNVWKYDIHTGKRTDLTPISIEIMTPDEAIVSESGGGGGFGDPLDRDPERVRRDAREGYISVERAHDVYGVVLNTGPERFVADHRGTEELRKALREKKGK
jgi:N-methylhydantoinase B